MKIAIKAETANGVRAIKQHFEDKKKEPFKKRLEYRMLWTESVIVYPQYTLFIISTFKMKVILSTLPKKELSQFSDSLKNSIMYDLQLNGAKKDDITIEVLS